MRKLHIEEVSEEKRRLFGPRPVFLLAGGHEFGCQGVEHEQINDRPTGLV